MLSLSCHSTTSYSLITLKYIYIYISSSIVHWVFNYLTNLQGTVFAHFLFTLYTADFRHSDSLRHMIIFADDSEITGEIRNDDGSVDSEEINNL